MHSKSEVPTDFQARWERERERERERDSTDRQMCMCTLTSFTNTEKKLFPGFDTDKNFYTNWLATVHMPRLNTKTFYMAKILDNTNMCCGFKG